MGDVMKASLLPQGIGSKKVNLDAPSINLHYLIAGEAHSNDEVILLIHGWPTSALLYRHMMLPLAERCRVVAIDLPGFGDSDKDPDASYSFRYHAECIQGLVESLGAKKIHLVVHDLGGPIGLWWAAKNSELIASYVLLDTIIYDDFSWAVKLFVGMSMLPGLRHWLSSAAGIKFAMRLGLENKHRLSKEVLEAYQAPFCSRAARKGLLASAHRLHRQGFKTVMAHIESVSQPLCMIYAEQDRILPEISQTFQRLKGAQPHAELHAVPDCGHFLQEDSPEQVLEPLLKFYQGLSVGDETARP